LLVVGLAPAIEPTDDRPEAVIVLVADLDGAALAGDADGPDGGEARRRMERSST
jgi:hypothetical protein